MTSWTGAWNKELSNRNFNIPLNIQYSFGRRGVFKGFSGTLKQKAWFLGFRETNWKPFEGDKSLSFFFFQAKFSVFFAGTSLGDFLAGERGEICRVPLTLHHVKKLLTW